MQAAASARRLPHLVLIAPAPRPPRPSLTHAWRRAIARYFPTEPGHAGGRSVPISVLEGRLDEIEAEKLRCDCIVSPANAFGIMDGGFDLALSRAFQGGSADAYFLTDHVQAHLRRRAAGFLPPGSCALVGLPEGVAGAGNAWGTRVLAVLPTMRVPGDVGWHRDLVYNATWALLAEVARWNADEGAHGGPIERVVMTGLGTGTGGVSAERCARQMVLAVKHFEEGVAEHARWETVQRQMEEVEETWTESE